MTPPPEILLVDDERTVRNAFRALFEAEGFAVRTAKGGDEGLAAFSERRPDLVILDVMMPKRNGLQTCEAIRALDARVPILFLTGVPSETTQLRAYGVGADDYIEKDANPDLVVAKVRAAVRRSRAASAPAPEATAAGRLRLGQVEVAWASLDVLQAGKPVARLTKTEGDILRILATPRGRARATDELIAQLRGGGFACVDEMLYVHVSNLRKKLGPAASLLTSARGVGYALLP